MTGRHLGVIFDLDGTLVDSGLDFDQMRLEMGLPEREPILEALDRLPPGPHRDQCLEVLRGHELRGALRADLIPGAAELLLELGRRGLPRAVLTRNSRESTDLVVSRLGLALDCCLTREDAPPKPHPGGLLECCQRWNLPPSRVLFIGDYLFDLQAGRRAGTTSVLLARGALPTYSDQADHIITHLDEVLGLVDAFIEV